MDKHFKDIDAAVYDKHPYLSREQAKAIVRTVFKSIKRELRAGNRVVVCGFGAFGVRRQAPRKVAKLLRDKFAHTAEMTNPKPRVHFVNSKPFRETLK